MSEIVPGSVGPRGESPRDGSPAHGRPEHPGHRAAGADREGAPEVGFATANPVTLGLLSRYLVGRVVAARVSLSLLIVAVALLIGAVALWEWGPRVLAVLVGLCALVVFAFRALVVAILRRVMGVGRLGPVEDRLRGLVADTQGDLRRELRRIGLPATVVGMPLLLLRILGKRRAATFARLQQFDLNRVVPRARQDELHFLVSSQLRRP